VAFPSGLLTINVSPVRDMIIPLVWVLSPPAPNATTDASKNKTIRFDAIVIRCIVASLFSSLLLGNDGLAAV
jgi:hypothetical protein